MSKKVAVLFSGGLESVTMLYNLIESYGKENVTAITIDFGQKEVIDDEQGNSFANNLIEKKITRYNAELLGVDYEIIDLSYFSNVLDFMKKRIEDTKKDDYLQISNLSLFPARNHLMIYSAIIVSEMRGITELYLGSALTDYVDGVGNIESTQEYLDKFNELNAISNEHSVILKTGLINDLGETFKLSKAKEIEYLHKRKVDFPKQVWTCLHPKLNKDNEYIQCGTCKSCVRNRASFISAGIKDPYEYHSDDWTLDPRMLFQMQLAGDDISMFTIKARNVK